MSHTAYSSIKIGGLLPRSKVPELLKILEYEYLNHDANMKTVKAATASLEELPLIVNDYEEGSSDKAIITGRLKGSPIEPLDLDDDMAKYGVISEAFRDFCRDNKLPYEVYVSEDEDGAKLNLWWTPEGDEGNGAGRGRPVEHVCYLSSDGTPYIELADLKEIIEDLDKQDVPDKWARFKEMAEDGELKELPPPVPGFGIDEEG